MRSRQLATEESSTMGRLQIARITLAIAFYLSAVSALNAAVKPHALFSEHAVLQQGVKVPVWGTTDQTEDVTVSFAGQQVTAKPADGKWRVDLEPLSAGGPHVLTINQ